MTLARRNASLGLALFALGCAAAKPQSLGVVDGRLTACPAAPHCVSSQATASWHAVSPIPYRTSRDEARERLVSIVRALPRAKVITDSPDYIHAEFPSRLTPCVDDLEIYLDDRAKVAQLRSASRQRYFDFGANRRRVNEIRAKFLSQGSEKRKG